MNLELRDRFEIEADDRLHPIQARVPAPANTTLPRQARTDPTPPQTRSRWRHAPALLAGLVLVALLVAAGWLYWDDAARYQSTDDAFIAARQFPIAPKVTGYITGVPVTDNQHVAAGDVVATLDDRDYRVALDQANAQVASAAAGIQNIDAQITVQQAQIAAGEAGLVQAQAALQFAEQQAARYQDLAKTGAGSLQNAQQYSSQLRQQHAGVDTAQAQLQVARRQADALKAQRESAVAALAQAKAQRD